MTSEDDDKVVGSAMRRVAASGRALASASAAGRWRRRQRQGVGVHAHLQMDVVATGRRCPVRAVAANKSTSGRREWPNKSTSSSGRASASASAAGHWRRRQLQGVGVHAHHTRQGGGGSSGQQGRTRPKAARGRNAVTDRRCRHGQQAQKQAVVVGANCRCGRG